MHNQEKALTEIKYVELSKNLKGCITDIEIHNDQM